MKKLLLIAALSLTVTATLTGQRMPEQLNKLFNAVYGVTAFYVDSVDENKLVEDAVRGMIEKLDPHSSYTNAKETKELTEPLQGEFEGIGIQFNMKEDTLYVIQTIPNGPSERVGILAGDRIVTVNDSTIAGVKMSRTDIMKRLRGKKGTKVNVQVKRRNVKELITFRITRDKIPLHSVDASYMLDERTGYVRISSFGAKTYDEMMEALDKLHQQGMQQVVIDLCDNGGGYLQAAVAMCNEFMTDGQMIVYTEGRAAPRSEAHARGNGRYKDLKMVVMVNQFSASASEIFSGAMQDWDRAVVVGRRTFGKGLVQRPLNFEDGSMLRLTVARYYTPSGRCIQKPYKLGNRKAYSEDLVEREREGEYYHLDSIHFPDTLRYTTLVNHRPVYGGGGVMPDIYVPVDTSEYSTYYRDLVAKGIVNQFVVNYVDKNRDALKKQYTSVQDFDQRFQLTADDMQQFIAMGEKDSVKYNEEKYRTSEQVLRTMIKGLIARDIYADPGAYTMIVNHKNRELKAALEVLYDEPRFQQLLQEGNRDYERLVKRTAPNIP
ncbi:MAG: S41 family peptidase [Muribaculaceae bacterium]|nr:S41 family peptidase [Muribaculaceae bacterium]